MIPVTNYSVEKLAQLICDYTYVDVAFDSSYGGDNKTYEYRVPLGIKVQEGDMCVIKKRGASGTSASSYSVARVVRVKDKEEYSTPNAHAFIVGVVDTSHYTECINRENQIIQTIRKGQENSVKATILQSLIATCPGLKTLIPSANKVDENNN